MILWSLKAKYCSLILATNSLISSAWDFKVLVYWSSFFFSSFWNYLISLSFAETICSKAYFCSWIDLFKDSHYSYYLSSDHFISKAVFFLFESIASCWIAVNLYCALRSSYSLEFFCSCSFFTLISWIGAFVLIYSLSISSLERFTCFLP